MAGGGCQSSLGEGLGGPSRLKNRAVPRPLPGVVRVRNNVCVRVTNACHIPRMPLLYVLKGLAKPNVCASNQD